MKNWKEVGVVIFALSLFTAANAHWAWGQGSSVIIQGAKTATQFGPYSNVSGALPVTGGGTFSIVQGIQNGVCTGSSVSVTTATTQLIPANTSRRALTIQQLTDNNTAAYFNTISQTATMIGGQLSGISAAYTYPQPVPTAALWFSASKATTLGYIECN